MGSFTPVPNSQVDTPAGSFLSFVKRFRSPAGTDANRLYYSLDYGLAHVVFLQGYCPAMRTYAVTPCLGPGTPQAMWLAADLAAVNRALTPWVIILIHQPWMNSNWAHRISLEGVEIQAVLEDLVQSADLVISGHVHSYERSARSYRFACNASAPASIVIGDGGNREGLATNFTSPQPAWSLLRQASYGHGQLTAVNATHLHWVWRQSARAAPPIGDDFYFVKGDAGACGGGVTRAPLR